MTEQQLAELERLDEQLPKSWDVDWNAPRNVLASDGSGKHIAAGPGYSEAIVAMRNALPDLIAAARESGRLQRQIVAAVKELERADDVRNNRTKIIGNAHVLLSAALKEPQ